MKDSENFCSPGPLIWAARLNKLNLEDVGLAWRRRKSACWQGVQRWDLVHSILFHVTCKAQREIWFTVYCLLGAFLLDFWERWTSSMEALVYVCESAWARVCACVSLFTDPALIPNWTTHSSIHVSPGALCVCVFVSILYGGLEEGFIWGDGCEETARVATHTLRLDRATGRHTDSLRMGSRNPCTWNGSHG